MTADSHEELISAYLDGELPDDQRAEVEKLLAENPQLRQLHDELRALRHELRSLPRHQLDHDVSGTVLRRAEQAVLRGGEGHVRLAADTDDAEPTSWWNRGAGWRRVIWPALAVAAALAILIYDSGRHDAERQVAQQPAEGPRSSARPEPVEGNADAVIRATDMEVDKERESEAADSTPSRAAGESAAAPAMPALRAAPQKEALQADETLHDLRLDNTRMQARSPDSTQDAMPAAPAVAAKHSAPSAEALGIAVSVAPEFLRDKKFEKLLDEHQIAWQRVDATSSDKPGYAQTEPYEQAKTNRKATKSYDLSPALAGSLRQAYLLEATPQRVDELLSAAGLSVIRRSESAKDDDVEAAREAPRQTADRPQEGVVVLLVAAPQAAPAEPQSEPAP